MNVAGGAGGYVSYVATQAIAQLKAKSLMVRYIKEHEPSAK